MSVHMTRGQTVSLTALTRTAVQTAPVKVETTREALSRNDVSAFHKAIKVFGVK